jgi:antitoxin ParD1/3/4
MDAATRRLVRVGCCPPYKRSTEIGSSFLGCSGRKTVAVVTETHDSLATISQRSLSEVEALNNQNCYFVLFLVGYSLKYPPLFREPTFMNISLTPELERYVNGKVDSGMYHSASEVIREGLRLLREKEELHRTKLEELRREIQIGLDQAERGQVSPLNEETLKEVKARGRQRLAAKQTPK